MNTIQQERKGSTSYWKIGDFSEMLGRHTNTVDKWFKDLEKENIHFVQRVGKEKVYDELDYKIALYIKNKRPRQSEVDEQGRKKVKTAIPAIFEELKTGEAGLELRTDYIIEDSHTLTEFEVSKIAEKHIQELKEELRTEFHNSMNNLSDLFRKVAQEELNKHPLLESSSLQRQRRVEDLIVQYRVMEKLKSEAKTKWLEQPEKERFTKVGFFRKKVENIERKNEFIENYINYHYEKELKEMFDDTEI